jgi:hypothetical protein
MDNCLRSLSYVILFAGLSAVSALGVIGFLNNVYADNTNMSDNMSMNANVTASANMTGNMNENMTGNMNENMTGNMNENMTGNMNENMTGNMTGTSNGPPIIQKILSPLQQFKSGTSATSVKCNEGFTLVIKIEDGSPACVTSQISQALVARGWGTTS